MELPLPYPSLPADPHARWLEVAHQFGAALMTCVRDRAYDQIPLEASEEAQAIAREAVNTTLQALSAFLDGVTAPSSHAGFQNEYALVVRVRDESTGSVVEAFEIAPEGDGLSMAIHSWLENDFDIAGRLRRAGSLPAEPPSPPVAPVAPHQREQRVFLFDTDGWGRCPFCDVAFTITNPGSLSAFHTTCRGPLRLKANSPSTP